MWLKININYSIVKVLLYEYLFTEFYAVIKPCISLRLQSLERWSELTYKYKQQKLNFCDFLFGIG